MQGDHVALRTGGPTALAPMLMVLGFAHVASAKESPPGKMLARLDNLNTQSHEVSTAKRAMEQAQQLYRNYPGSY